MSSVKKNSKKKMENKRIVRYFIDERFLLIPLLLILCIVPLVMYMKKVTLNDPGNLYWDGLSVHFDIYSYYKMALLLIFTISGILLFILSDKKDILLHDKKKYYVSMGIYLLFVLLSALASEYKTVAFFGFLQRYEGAYVLFAYIIVMFLSMNLPTKESSIKLIFICLLCSSFLVFSIGAFQFFGLDYFKSSFFYQLITPASLKDDWSSLYSNFAPHTVFTSLYNPNYVGSYTALLIPIILVFLLFTRRIVNKILAAALLFLAVINWIGCDSRAGVIGVLVSLAIMLILLRRKLLQHWLFGIIITAILCSALIAVNFATNGVILNKIARMATIEGKEETAVDLSSVMNKTLAGLKDVAMDSHIIKLVTIKGTLQIAIINGQLAMADENNKVLAIANNNSDIYISDNRFSNIKLSVVPDKGLIEIYYNNYHLYDAIYTKDGFKSNTNRWMLYRNNKNIESFGLIVNESLASNRGYIWSRTIPLLKNTIFLGYGPDTFALYFPQYDFLSKLKLYGTGGIFVDKPHNMYLQTAVNTGIISLLALLVIFGMYFITSIKIYIKQDYSNIYSIAGLACFTAFCGYATAGIFNDSVVSVAPVFWILLGMGIGINIKLCNNSKPACK